VKAAGKDGPSVADEDLAAFRRSIAGLVPAAFTPQGNGDLKILVTYPHPAADDQIESYIEDRVNLPREPSAKIEFRATDTESIVVVLLRTSMSVTEVPELREILRHWSDALHDEQPQDFLRWRQRLGYQFRWLATTEDDRVNIMHRLLCAMWNEQIEVIGQRESPRGIVVSLHGERPVEMELRLDPFGRASSWVSLLRAYEEWTFADGDQIRLDFCKTLMQTLPQGIRNRPRKPSGLYTWFVDDLRRDQEKLLRAMLSAMAPSARSWVRELLVFWAKTVPAALNMPFHNVAHGSLGDLRSGDFDLTDPGGDWRDRDDLDGAGDLNNAADDGIGNRWESR